MRHQILLLIGAVHFATVRAAITKILAPYVHIIKYFDVCNTIDQTPIYELFESLLGANRS